MRRQVAHVMVPGDAVARGSCPELSPRRGFPHCVGAPRGLPAFSVKPSVRRRRRTCGARSTRRGVQRHDVEYWLDRELTLAGRLILNGEVVCGAYWPDCAYPAAGYSTWIVRGESSWQLDRKHLRRCGRWITLMAATCWSTWRARQTWMTQVATFDL